MQGAILHSINLASSNLPGCRFFPITAAAAAAAKQQTHLGSGRSMDRSRCMQELEVSQNGTRLYGNEMETQVKYLSCGTPSPPNTANHTGSNSCRSARLLPIYRSCGGPVCLPLPPRHFLFPVSMERASRWRLLVALAARAAMRVWSIIRQEK